MKAVNSVFASKNGVKNHECNSEQKYIHRRKERYRGRKSTEEGKVQRKERYRGRKDTEEGKIQRKERYRGRKDTEEVKIQRK